MIKIIPAPPPPKSACADCGDLTGPTNLIARTRVKPRKHPKGEELTTTHLVCGRCFNVPDWRERQAAEAKAAPAPAQKPGWNGATFEPRTLMAATQWKTGAEAEKRAAVVAYHLAAYPEITPRDPSSPGPFFVLGDSPLVPGFDKAKCPNPLA